MGKQIFYNIKELKFPDFFTTKKIEKLQKDHQDILASNIKKVYEKEVTDTPLEELRK